MFITLDDNFYPLELTLKEQVLQYNYLLDRNIHSWKTRGRLRMRTERKLLNKQLTRKYNRLQVWHAKQTRFFYQLNGYINRYHNFLLHTLFFLFFLELQYNMRSSTLFLFFLKSCSIRRIKKNTFTFLKT
jgi:hypothetical protein